MDQSKRGWSRMSPRYTFYKLGNYFIIYNFLNNVQLKNKEDTLQVFENIMTELKNDHTNELLSNQSMKSVVNLIANASNSFYEYNEETGSKMDIVNITNVSFCL